MNTKPKLFASELTPIGEQYVIPGCEQKTVRQGQQMNLWGSAPPQSRTTDVPEQPVRRAKI